jgi:hypothetical protein
MLFQYFALDLLFKFLLQLHNHGSTPRISKSLCSLSDTILMNWRRQKWWKEQMLCATKFLIFHSNKLVELNIITSLAIQIKHVQCQLMSFKSSQSHIPNAHPLQPMNEYCVWWSVGIERAFKKSLAPSQGKSEHVHVAYTHHDKHKGERNSFLNSSNIMGSFLVTHAN